MKLNVFLEEWEIDVENFLKGFINPGNMEHELWAALCRLSLQKGISPLKTTVNEIKGVTKLERKEIEKLLETLKESGYAFQKNR